MEIQVVEFAYRRPVQALPLNLGDIQAFEQLRREKAGVVFVVPEGELDRLAGTFPTLVEKPRQKNPATQLARYVRQRKLVPLVRCPYASGSRLEGAINALLPEFSRESNIGFLGVHPELFQALQRQASVVVPPGSRGAEAAPTGEERARSSARTPELLKALGKAAADADLCGMYLGDSRPYQLARVLAVRAAESDVPVLITGESGTGKEILAEFIHKLSPTRGKKEWQALNCAAVPREMFESELFGHERGAFTGAIRQRIGAWEAANDSSLFLDEVAELAPEFQAKLLRALQTGQIRRLGSNQSIPVNARIISATNQDLLALVNQGRFREDLYFRLAHIPIRTPALRESGDGFAGIARGLWRKMVRSDEGTLSVPVIALLQAQPWPGNVRQLKALLSRVYTLFKRVQPSVEEVEIALSMDRPLPPAPAEPAGQTPGALRRSQIECVQHLRWVSEVLRACDVLWRDFCAYEETPAMLDHTRLSLGSRLSELDTLLTKPALFRDAKVVAAVARLGEWLENAAALLSAQPEQARENWERRGRREYRRVLAVLLKEIERLETFR